MPTLRCSGILFDLDGTLIDSIHAVNRAWLTFAKRHNLDPEEVLHSIHGRRAVDSISMFVDQGLVEAESIWLREQEVRDTYGVVALAGALDLIASLPAGSWGLVTSGTSDVARARLQAAGIPEPQVTVFGEDVTYGKPFPEPYLRGAELMELPPSRLIGFEDTSAGLQSVTSAGLLSVGVGISHPHMIYDYTKVRAEQLDGELAISFPDSEAI